MCFKRNAWLRVSVMVGFVALCCAWAMSGGTAKANLIAASTNDYPNLYSTCEGVLTDYGISYTASSGYFCASGFPQNYAPSGRDPWDLYTSDSNCAFDLSMTLTSSTATTTPTTNISGGTVTIYGSNSPGYGPGVLLLSGSIEKFGSSIAAGQPESALFDFLFRVSGGALAPDYGNVGAEAYITISPSGNNSFTGNFQHDFSFSGIDGTVDVLTLVPEPSSAALMLVLTAAGLAGITLRRSWMRRSV